MAIRKSKEENYEVKGKIEDWKLFDELLKYKDNDNFLFRSNERLGEKCNAPINKSGIYLIYELKGDITELVYIGRSGEVKSDGKMFIRKAGMGGIKDRLVNGKQFGSPRRNSWKIKMIDEKLEALKIYWYVTHNENYEDCPKILENKLLNKYYQIFGRLPKWNKEF